MGIRSAVLPALLTGLLLAAPAMSQKDPNHLPKGYMSGSKYARYCKPRPVVSATKSSRKRVTYKVKCSRKALVFHRQIYVFEMPSGEVIERELGFGPAWLKKRRGYQTVDGPEKLDCSTVRASTDLENPGPPPDKVSVKLQLLESVNDPDVIYQPGAWDDLKVLKSKSVLACE